LSAQNNRARFEFAHFTIYVQYNTEKID